MGAKYAAIVLFAASFLCSLSPSFAQSQDGKKEANLLRQDNIARTGATVPLRGESKSAGQTSLDTEIERHNDRISRTICSNC